MSAYNHFRSYFVPAIAKEWNNENGGDKFKQKGLYIKAAA
jgi:hypothetical protein